MTHFDPKISSQRGSAIIIALFVVSLVAAIAVAMMVHLHINIRRTQLLQQSNRANLYAQGSIAWAIDTLVNDWNQQRPNQVIDRTPIQSKTDTVQGFNITSTIYDAQGNFNINNLSSADYQQNFLRLLQAVNPSMENTQAVEIFLALRDWIQPATTDSFDAFYAKLKPPYRAPHHPLTSVSELLLVKGMTPALFNQLLPFITVLPGTTPININNAAPPVIMSLSPTMTASTAQTIATYLKQQPAGSPQILQNYDVLRNNPIQADMTTLVSNYFLVKTDVTSGGQETILYTLMMRSIQNSKAIITILWQTKGTL